jgi:hypothetical protein
MASPKEQNTRPTSNNFSAFNRNRRFTSFTDSTLYAGFSSSAIATALHALSTFVAKLRAVFAELRGRTSLQLPMPYARTTGLVTFF